MMYPDLRRHARLFSEHTELRVQENRALNVTLLNGDAVANATEITRGVSARVYKDGSWGFTSTPHLDDDAIARVVAGATGNARFLAGRHHGARGRDHRLHSLPAAPRSGDYSDATDTTRLPPSAQVEFLRDLDASIAAAHPELTSRRLVLRTLDMEKALLTSDGACAGSLVPRAHIYVILARAADAGDTVEQWEVFGDRGTFEDVFTTPAALMPRVDGLCRHLAAKASGVYPDAGLHDVVLGPNLAGILAHEAIGHTTEADIVLGGSAARESMGERVASELVTLVDFASTALGSTCPVPVRVDDEGTAARDVVIIDHGTLRGFMHSRETALLLDAAPTGNARAFSFSDEPLVRMRNTAILPGTSRLEDLIASVDNGYYLEETGGGQADSTSEFMFEVTRGYEIRKGKLGRSLRDTSVSGVAFDMLKTITMLSRDMSWTCSGFCGKKQPIPVGMGGPAIRCRITVGGR